jgi:hypothetical protein
MVVRDLPLEKSLKSGRFLGSKRVERLVDHRKRRIMVQVMDSFCRRNHMSGAGRWTGWVGMVMMVFMASCTAAPLAFALTLNLQWEEPAGVEAKGYKLHYGHEHGDYTTTIDVGRATTHTLEDLEDGQDYFIAVTAYDDDGESWPSQEVSYIPAIHNRQPKAEDVEFTADRSSVYRGALKAADPDDNPLEFVIVCPPTQGTLELEDPYAGVFTYVPFPDATGSDSFLYRVRDGMGESNLAVASANFPTPGASSVDDSPVVTDEPEPMGDHSWLEEQSVRADHESGEDLTSEE